jgi:hypothetical protein
VRTAGGTVAAINLYAGNNTTTSKLSIGQIGAIDWDLGVTATNGWFQIGGLGGTMAQAYTIARTGTGILAHTFYVAGAARTEISATGVAVTGTLSSTGAATITGPVNTPNAFVSTGPVTANGADRVTLDFGSGVVGRVLAWGPNNSTAGQLDLGVLSANASVGNTSIARISAAGLAVTGGLSCNIGASFATSSGSVGIGTASPGYKLDVNSTTDTKLLLTGSTNQNAMRFGAAGSANEYYVAAGNNLVTGGDKGFLIYNSTANQPQLFIEQATRNVKVFAGFEAAGALAIGNTVAAAVAIASTHKVTIVIGGVTYYLLATNVA